MTAQEYIKKWIENADEKPTKISPQELGEKLLARLNAIYLSGKDLENRSILPLQKIIQKLLDFNNLPVDQQGYIDFTYYNSVDDEKDQKTKGNT